MCCLKKSSFWQESTMACPVTSVECERSFSVMRRLKNVASAHNWSIPFEPRVDSCCSLCKSGRS